LLRRLESGSCRIQEEVDAEHRLSRSGDAENERFFDGGELEGRDSDYEDFLLVGGEAGAVCLEIA
jgi:hypothetical protein